jgi:hypothetical protein
MLNPLFLHLIILDYQKSNKRETLVINRLDFF